MNNLKQKIILFGGTFDPIHNGHLAVAADAFERLRADRLFFIPVRRSPHKTQPPAASGQDRLAMIRLAIKDREGFAVSDCELRRPEPSYTLDTILHFRERFGPEAELYWLVGADAVQSLERWHRIEEILEQCRVCIMHRGRMPRPDLRRLVPALGADRVAQLGKNILPTPLVDISSTAIRARLAAGQPVQGLVPEPVLKYIRQKGLYGLKQ
ncbi:MAG: nicotinate (nicotinamide) nucleotide adenylyltransferase [Planctomycetes bacterium]|jgi:nicotinate-nucleotide adenylyltransferase|nr:nicotinate (nicotinamide) nucleotide adenylyltransferase [Planctomycetota bacterium]